MLYLLVAYSISHVVCAIDLSIQFVNVENLEATATWPAFRRGANSPQPPDFRTTHRTKIKPAAPIAAGLGH